MTLSEIQRRIDRATEDLGTAEDLQHDPLIWECEERLNALYELRDELRTEQRRTDIGWGK